jgi:hypothetical protein
VFVQFDDHTAPRRFDYLSFILIGAGKGCFTALIRVGYYKDALASF